MTTADHLAPLLCEQWCEGVVIEEDRQGGYRLSLPHTEPDGDQVTVWLRPVIGGWRVSDAGSTLMRLSYDQDIDNLLSGTRGRLVERIAAEQGVKLVEGELVLEFPESRLNERLLDFTQAMLRIADLRLWSRSRVSKTFYDDLLEQLQTVAGVERVHADFIVSGVPSAEDYPVDYYVEGGSEPLYVFGVPSRDKARLATIVLQHLQQQGAKFNSLVVFDNITQIANSDLRRLMNAANDMVDSLDAQDALDRKVRHRIQA